MRFSGNGCQPCKNSRKKVRALVLKGLLSTNELKTLTNLSVMDSSLPAHVVSERADVVSDIVKRSPSSMRKMCTQVDNESDLEVPDRRERSWPSPARLYLVMCRLKP